MKLYNFQNLVRRYVSSIALRKYDYIIHEDSSLCQVYNCPECYVIY